MDAPRDLILRARLVLTQADTWIESGAVIIRQGRIVAVGRCPAEISTAQGDVVDLGEVVLCPGLINTHCHLDFTHMAGQLAPTATFPEWIQSLLHLRSSWSDDDVAASWLDGARSLLAHGVTTVADHETYPHLLKLLLPQTPLRVYSFIELVDLRSGPHLAMKVQAACEQARSLQAVAGWRGLAPHAPYTTTGPFIQQIAAACRTQGWRLSVHAAESESEYSMFMRQRGPMHDWLKRQRDMSDCGQGSPLRYLANAQLLGEDCLVVHANYAGTHDAHLLARKRVSVAHCPQSHAYFGHRPFRAQMMAAAGVNLCLGTDSLASTLVPRGTRPQLSLINEIRLFRSKHASFSPQSVFAMATINGAKALGLDSCLGRLLPGYWADLIAIGYDGPASSAVEAILHYEGRVSASMIDGRWIIAPNCAPAGRREQ
jgi:aminodeoxyfutalosine deaminase